MVTSSKNIRPPFVDNPFRVLRLSAKAELTDIQTRYAEARVSARLNDDGGLEESDRLLKAHSELLNLNARWIYDVCWFYDPPESLFDGNIGSENEVLEKFQRQSLLTGEEGIQGKHDFANWLFLQAGHSQDQKWELSVRALSNWSDLIDNPEYTRMLNAIYGDRSPSRELLWNQAVTLQFAAAALEDVRIGDSGHVVTYIEAFNSSGRDPDELVDVASDALKELCGRVRGVITSTNLDSDSDRVDDTELQQFAETIMLQARPLNSAVSAIGRLGSETTAVLAECNTVLDAAAMHIQSGVISYFNKVEGSAKTGIPVLIQAKGIAATESVTGRLSDDINDLGYFDAMGEASGHIEGQRLGMALDAANRAVRLARNEEQREQARTYVSGINEVRNRRPQPSQIGDFLSKGLGRIVGLAIVIGIIFGCNALLQFSSNDSRPSYSPPARSVPTYNTPKRTAPDYNPPIRNSPSNSVVTESRRELERQIDANKLSLDLMENQHTQLIAEYESICPVHNCELPDHLYREAKDLNTRLNELENEHEQLLAETNNLIDRYNRTR